MIEQRLMAAGSFDIPLREGTAREIVDLTALDEVAFSHVIVTPNRVDPRDVDETVLLDMARYVGVYRNRSNDGLRLAGAGLSVWMGDEDDKGVLTEVFINSTRTFEAWADAIFEVGGEFDMGNGLTVTPESVSPPVGDYKLRFEPGVTARVMLDELCVQAGAEWYVANNGVIHISDPPGLFPTWNIPTVLVSRLGGSREVAVTGLFATTFESADDVEDYASEIQVHYTDKHRRKMAELVGAPEWYRLDGDPVRYARLVSYPDVVVEAVAEKKANGELEKTGEMRRALQLAVDTYDIGSDVVPGDTIYVFDDRAGYSDLTTQLVYRGEVIFPTTRRVYATTWPVKHGMGVYLLVGGTSGEVFDLSDWVEWEDGDTTIEVGAARRNLLRQQRRGAA